MRSRVVATLICSQIALALPLATLGATDESRPLEGVVGEAAVVARVRVIALAPLFFGEGQICGYRFTVRVAQSFKGKASEFYFLAVSERDFDGFEKEYFLIAYGRTREDIEYLRKGDASRLTGTELNLSLCRLEDLLYVKQSIQMLIPFSKRALKAGEWLKASRTSVVSEERFQQERIGGPASDAAFVSWPDVEAAVTGALAK